MRFSRLTFFLAIAVVGPVAAAACGGGTSIGSVPLPMAPEVR